MHDQGASTRALAMRSKVGMPNAGESEFERALGGKNDGDGDDDAFQDDSWQMLYNTRGEKSTDLRKWAGGLRGALLRPLAFGNALFDVIHLPSVMRFST